MHQQPVVSSSIFSKKLKPAETKYTTFDGEVLAAHLAIKHFGHFDNSLLLLTTNR